MKSKYDIQLKKIKKEIKKYSEIEILNFSIEYLYAPCKNEIERISRQPWLVFLVIKWAFIESSTIEYRRDKLTNKKFLAILQSTLDLASIRKMPTEYSSVKNWMRQIAYQQFLYQQSFSLGRLGRNYLLFAKLPENSYLQKQFKNLHGLSIFEYIALSFSLASFFLDWREKAITIDFFRPAFSVFSFFKVENFLNSLSIDISSVDRELKKANCSKSSYPEYVEQTPFIKFPLVKSNRKYVCIHPNILFRTLEHFVYDSLKENESGKFMREFGVIFEKYLEKGLALSGLKYLTEKGIQNILDTKKCVDYLVCHKEANIFIDAKGVEMHYLGKVSDDPKVIEGKIKGSALKAIEQALDLNEKLLNFNSCDDLKHQNKSYLLVVTYKELYIGNGRSLYESIGGDKIDSIYSKYVNGSHIPLEHIYFITVDEFDTLTSLVKSCDMDIVGILDSAVESDKDPASRKFNFEQHLHALSKNVPLAIYLEAATDKVVQSYEPIAE